nr:reverse transcriptase domain-containing protein [Tanacetum cinerariifolium]
TPKEILAAEASKFQPPPPMVTPVEKRSSNKFCDFHNNKGHSTNECMQLKKQIEELRQMVPATTSLTGFSGETTWPLGQLKLQVTIGDATYSTKAWMNFMIVKSLSPYNGIIGQPGLKAIQAIPSTKKRGQAPKRTKAIQAEVEKLVEAGIMREVFYHDWLSNPVMVKKHDGSWRMCVDFTDLNKACPQDCYPLSEIDWKRLMDKAFENQMGRNIEVYVDDLVVKSHTETEMTLKKCIKKSDFRWTTEAEQAFQQLKQHLSALPLLAAPKPQEDLIMYLSATHGAISAVLLTERGTAQMPVYFISRTLQGPELNYSSMEKLVLSLVFAAKRLRRYFQAHPIAVITDQPIKQVMSRPDAAGRLQKWSIILGEHNITYRPRTSIKGQILADFLNEMPSNASQGTSVAETQEEPWTLFTDGSSCVDGSGAGLILTNPDGVEFTYALRFQFAASNNKAEYEALIAGLQIAMQMGVKNIQANVDSKLVDNQVLGTYIAKEDNMIKYLDIAKDLVSGFKTFSISQVPQSKNKKAYTLNKIASTSFAHLSKQEARKIRLKARQDELMKGILYKRSFLTPWLRCVGPLQAEYVMKEIHEGSCSMHAGPRPLSERAEESQVPDRRNGLLHEVDRSKSGGNDYRWTSEEIRM